MDERDVECPICGTEHSVALHGPVTERRPDEPSDREYEPRREHANRIACDHEHVGGRSDDFWVIYRLAEPAT